MNSLEKLLRKQAFKTTKLCRNCQKNFWGIRKQYYCENKCRQKAYRQREYFKKVINK